MNRVIAPGARSGAVRIPASKSQAHRLLIAAACSGNETTLTCDGLSNDILATIDCLNAMGADISVKDDSIISVKPISEAADGTRELHCGESGSTLRFMIPLVGALGIDSAFVREGRLPERPLEPLLSQLKAHGMSFSEDGKLLYTTGRLHGGSYTLPGNVSSQYITGLLMALPLCNEDSSLEITGKTESQAYILMTLRVLEMSGIEISKTATGYFIRGGQRYRLSGSVPVEGDCSNAAFFLCMGALSEKGIKVSGLNPDTAQGDMAVVSILKGFGADVSETDEVITVRKSKLKAQTVDASPIPDLIPVLSVVAAVSEGETRFINAGRLRLKESDRLESTSALINALGGNAMVEGDTLIVTGKPTLSGGSVDSCNDHRIAMAAATAACACTGEVTVNDSDCVKKSYPRFWQDFEALENGGIL